MLFMTRCVWLIDNPNQADEFFAHALCFIFIQAYPKVLLVHDLKFLDIGL